MSIEPKDLDPRIRRTRALLEEALVKLLETKTFAEISVQDLADAATLNRGTFYAHYPDKYALLQCVTARRFDNLLKRREVVFDDTCGSALQKMFLAICDYLAGASSDCGAPAPAVDPHMELAIVAVVQQMLLEGLKRQQPDWHRPLSQDMVAATLSAALYGAAKQWFVTIGRAPAEDSADEVAGMLLPLVHQEAKV